MGNEAIINASPLIFLSRGQHLDLLRLWYTRVRVPKAVAEEINRREPDDITVMNLRASSWIEIVPSCSIPEVILEWGLGPGESSVLAYAYNHPGVEIIIDDLLGRKCAQSLNLQFRGTLGLILKAKADGQIRLARPVMEDLIKGGLYLSRTVLNEALKLVGE